VENYQKLHCRVDTMPLLITVVLIIHSFFLCCDQALMTYDIKDVASLYKPYGMASRIIAAAIPPEMSYLLISRTHQR